MSSFDALGQQIFWSMICLIYTPVITLVTLATFHVFRDYSAGQKLLAYGIGFFLALGFTLLILRFISEKAWIFLLVLSATATVVVIITKLLRWRHRNDEE